MIKDIPQLIIPKNNLITVETRRNGRLRDRVKTHNLITDVGAARLKYLRDAGLYTGIAAGLNTHDVPPDLFNTLVALTDNTTPTADEEYSWSQVVAWANKTAYTGADTKRGTVNLGESYADNSHVHWVMDFPTHAGNDAPINSIGWEYCLTSSDYIQGNCKQANLFDFSALHGISIKAMGNKYGDYNYIYAFSEPDGTHITFYKLNPLTGSIIDTIGPITRPVTNQLVDFVIVGDIAYVCENNGTGYKKVLAINLISETVITYTLNVTTPCITFDGASFWGSIYNTTEIVKYNADFTENTRYTVPYAGRYLKYNEGLNALILGHSLNDDIVLLSLTGKILNHARSTDGTVILEGNTQNYIFHDDKLDLITWESLGARGLLPSPISKTSADTMRITYDFDISI